MAILRKVLITGVLAGIVIWIIGLTIGGLTMDVYKLTPQLWKPMDPVWMLVHDIIIGIILAAVYSIIQTAISGKGWSKGLEYGFLIWLVSTLPGMLSTYSTMTVPVALIFAWMLDGLIANGLMGVVIGFGYEKV